MVEKRELGAGVALAWAAGICARACPVCERRKHRAARAALPEARREGAPPRRPILSLCLGSPIELGLSQHRAGAEQEPRLHEIRPVDKVK